MNRDSNSSIIPKIIVFLGTASVVGIILLFFRSRPVSQKFRDKIIPSEKLFTQVIAAALPQVLKLWEQGDRLISKEGTQCPMEIDFGKKVGRSYYQCQPHLWQCYWQGRVVSNPLLKIEIFGQTFHVEAKASFPSIPTYSEEPRFYQMIKRPGSGLNLNYGYIVELIVREIPGLSQSMILTDSCRDVYLPQRIYGYGKPKDKMDEGFIWDNFDRHLFLDKFYVTHQQVNEWRLLTGQIDKVIVDRKLWPHPATLDLADQIKYCGFFGKRVMEAKLFDAATMSPSDTKDPIPEKISRPQTPWQRDLSKSFLGMARINPDYQLSPLDCQLAQVQGCAADKFFTTDSATWMGFNYALGFYPESLINDVEPSKNLKLSSKFLPPSSEWHELGLRAHWKGLQDESEVPAVAFRCYEEVAP